MSADGEHPRRRYLYGLLGERREHPTSDRGIVAGLLDLGSHIADHARAKFEQHTWKERIIFSLWVAVIIALCLSLVDYPGGSNPGRVFARVHGAFLNTLATTELH